ncbi:MAG: hypothetical protein V3U75_05915 [Methylococcaceae bacterium]
MSDLKQNITLSLEKSVIHDARILAARRSTSISALLAKELGRIVKQDKQFRQARLDARVDLEQGFHLGGKLADRDSLHER